MSSSPVNDFVVVTRELPRYLASNQVGSVAQDVAVRNLALLGTFSSKTYPYARLLDGAQRELALDENRSRWGSSWTLEQQKEMLKTVAASFYVLRKAVAEQTCLNFTSAELREAVALKGLNELASVINTYWKENKVYEDILALGENLLPLEQEQQLSPATAMHSTTSLTAASSASSDALKLLKASWVERDNVRNTSARGGMCSQMEQETPPVSPQEEAWWSCLNIPLPSFGCLSPSCYPTWCVKWLKTAADME